ncbi:MAG: hypothetical protein ILA11_10800 [Butyrivibrio sp.]|nr:hypothetical protein [Butyrivibrio sp.]
MENGKDFWLTTVDNPFDPFTQWSRWYSYDETQGYHTCETVARLTGDCSNLSDEEEQNKIYAAIQTVLDWYDGLDIYQIAVEGETKQF